MYIPAHCLNAPRANSVYLMCSAVPNCSPGTDPGACSRYALSSYAEDPDGALIYQPGINAVVAPNPGSEQYVIGYPQIWDPHFPDTSTTDVAWVALDNNNVPNDHSLKANQFLTYNGPQWDGEDATDFPVVPLPAAGTPMTILTGDCANQHGYHSVGVTFTGSVRDRLV
jgi:hypothetical protein